MKRIARLFSALALLPLLTGCTVPTDAYLDKVKTEVSKTAFRPTGEMASGCLGFYLLCTQPLYEPSFTASSATNVTELCKEFAALGHRLGAVAYASSGYPAYKLPKNPSEFENFCSQALSTELKAGDGSQFYQGVVLFDDGENDGWGKVYSLARGNSVNPKDFFLVISFSKDRSRVGWIDYGTEKPKVLTQEELDLRY
jgi:hypothetical protein